MTLVARLFIVLAASASITGDYYLKLYGDGRRTAHLVACLLIWEICAILWVLAYRERVPIGQSTVYGQAIVVTANVLVGLLVFEERLRPAQWAGAALVMIGILLVG